MRCCTASRGQGRVLCTSAGRGGCKSAVPAGCEVTADTTIRLGGLRAKCGAVEADDTLDMKLEAQKDWFLQNSGMSIAL